ncbi:DUF1592 domain-containing protein [Undibacterium luofuense]|uniref:DUF1592 domain-containing protein n=1 Tax=Undibacterium luofuense TaxID=2828733 RepID=UPI0030EC3675
MPDDTLFKLAEQNKLHVPAVLEAQCVRMLKDPKSRALVDNFVAQWLNLRNLTAIQPDTGRFPTFNEELRDAMRKETELFVQGVIQEDRNILELLDSKYTYLNDRLAQHYGIQGVEGHEFRRVSLTDSRRGGLITHASILTLTSNPTRTSPVKRGKWVLEQILGVPPPPPPPNVPELKEANGKELTGTLKERMEQHRKDPGCASCHARLDPMGFGLENYNAVGGWRDVEHPSAGRQDLPHRLHRDCPVIPRHRVQHVP